MARIVIDFKSQELYVTYGVSYILLNKKSVWFDLLGVNPQVVDEFDLINYTYHVLDKMLKNNMSYLAKRVDNKQVYSTLVSIIDQCIAKCVNSEIKGSASNMYPDKIEEIFSKYSILANELKKEPYKMAMKIRQIISEHSTITKKDDDTIDYYGEIIYKNLSSNNKLLDKLLEDGIDGIYNYICFILEGIATKRYKDCTIAHDAYIKFVLFGGK